MFEPKISQWDSRPRHNRTKSTAIHTSELSFTGKQSADRYDPEEVARLIELENKGITLTEEARSKIRQYQRNTA